MNLIWFAPVGSIIALLFAVYLIISVLRKEEGTDKMKEISHAIREGASAYLKRQYLTVIVFFVVMFIILGVLSFVFRTLSPLVPFAFLTGGFFSGLSGFIGMSIATRANNRTAWAAKKSLNSGLRVAFSAGTVMGMTVVGLGLLDLSLWYFLIDALLKTSAKEWINPSGLPELQVITQTMLTFGMGASSQALFARVGGGIFTKAADVGADLVGKVEAGIPEDDPRNPAVIADNVGDNVGDVAGMGADLYESYVGSIVATMALGVSAFASQGMELQAVTVPIVMATIGVLASIIGTFFVRSKEDATQKNLLWSLRKGIYFSTFVILIASFFLVYYTFDSGFGHPFNHIGIWIAIVAGLVAGNVIGYFTEYFTSDNYKPTKKVSEQAQTGSATVIIGGISLGMLSTFVPVLTVIIASLVAYFSAGGGSSFLLGLYGISIAAVGMLSTLGITLATDAYGPVADNAGGCAEMAHMDKKVRERTDALDSLGNTTAATGKGFAIGSAALTALALIAAYTDEIRILLTEKLHASSEIMSKYFVNSGTADNPIWVFVDNLLDINVLVGVFVGACLPFVIVSMTLGAVGRAANKMVIEVRRQFKEKPGIIEGKDKPDYANCVRISTIAAQKEMILPSLIVILVPIIMGIFFGPKGIVSMLACSLATGFVLAIMLANAGGSWDNAKKFIEKGNFGGKGSEPHKAAIVGDTVGDPFKDTSGPSLNILLKLMSMVSIVFGVSVYYVYTQIGIENIFEWFKKMFG